jgi:threonylcarbamoyladenosine tRNA methylthiotransferase MtaB
VNVYFHTFGCKANQYDTEVVRQAFAEQGAVIVAAPADADLAVVNSCTVTGEAEAKLRHYVRRLGRAGCATVVMGCAAARERQGGGRGAQGGGAIAALPGVRAVVGGADPAAVLRAAGYHAIISPPGPPPSALRRAGTGVRSRGWLKIQDGCDEHCTFCATTIARGANRSRSIPELVAEATALAGFHAELVVTGIHIGTYGRDRTTDNGERKTLGELLEALIEAVPSVRFRLSSIEATEVDDTIARLLIEAPRHLAAHLHAPLQSGSNRVLKRMGRHWYTAESYRARIEWLAARLPVLGLGADIIAGFPGEAATDHEATVALIEALPYTYLHVFPYSARPGTAAGRLGEAVPPQVVRDRARELRLLGDVKKEAYRKKRKGQTADGVVSGHAAGRLEVLTEDYLSVYLPTSAWDGRPRCEVTVD